MSKNIVKINAADYGIDERKAEAERIKREEEEARAEAELSKGDAEKVKDLCSDLAELCNRYSFKSKKNKKMYSDVCVLICRIIEHIKVKIK